MTRPLERAQEVCRLSSSLAASQTAGDLEAMTMALLRTAHHDRATLEHSLVLFRTRLREHPSDLVSRKGAALMKSVLGLLGVGRPVAPRRRSAARGE